MSHIDTKISNKGVMLSLSIAVGAHGSGRLNLAVLRFALPAKMILTRYILFCLCIFVSFVHGEELSEFKNWTRAEDNRTISAVLISFDLESNSVTLKMKGGKVVNIEVSILIPEHRSRLESIKREMDARKEAGSRPRMESFTPEGGGGHKIHIYKPAGYIDNSPSSKERPIAFLYSAAGRSIRLVNRLKKVSDELGWVLVGVDAYKNTTSLTDGYDERMKNTKIAFQWVEQNISFDPKKIVFGGMSGGAWWAYQSASDLTRKAAGVLAFGGWMGNMHYKKYSRRMAVALVNGNKDRAAIANEANDTGFLKRKSSAKVKAFRFPGGHVIAPPEVALEAARWIHETKKFGSNKSE